MANMTLEDMRIELEAVRKKTYKKDGNLRKDATEENVARFAELEQQIAAEVAYMESDDGKDGAGGADETPTDETPTDDNRSDAEKLAGVTELLRREKLITAAFQAPKGVAIRERRNPDGENVRIDEAMLPALAEAERLPVSIPEALAEKLINAKKAEVLCKAVERRIRCYVKKAGFHEHPRTHHITEWDGGLKKDLSEENIAKADFWLLKIGRIKRDEDGEILKDKNEKVIIDYRWDTTIVIPNM